MKKSAIREMRAVKRYSVQLPVCVTWREPDALRPPLNTLTRDISTRGMFVISDLEPAKGTLLEFEIDMAWDEQTPLVVVRGAGRVVRTQRRSSGPGGFAVQNMWFHLGEPEQGQALASDSSANSVRQISFSFNGSRSTPRRGLTVVPSSARKRSNLTSDRGGEK